MSIESQLFSHFDTQERIDAIDVAKGICILLIMISHLGLELSILPYLSTGFVAIFYLMCGITYKSRCIKEDIIRKSKRFLIPYFIYAIISLLIESIHLLMINDYDSILYGVIGIFYSRFSIFPLGTPSNVYLLSFNHPIWFLPSIFVSFVLFRLFIELPYFLKFCFPIVAIILTILSAKADILLPWSMDTAFFTSLLIMLGYYLKGTILMFLRSNKAYAILIMLCLLNITLYRFNNPINLSVRIYGGGNTGYSILICLMISLVYSLAVLVLGNLIYKTRVGSILTTIGKMSLTLMCVHIPIFHLIEYGDLHFSVTFINGWFFYSYKFFWIIISVFVAYGIQHFLKMYKYRCSLFEWL